MLGDLVAWLLGRSENAANLCIRVLSLAPPAPVLLLLLLFGSLGLQVALRVLARQRVNREATVSCIMQGVHVKRGRGRGRGEHEFFTLPASSNQVFQLAFVPLLSMVLETRKLKGICR